MTIVVDSTGQQFMHTSVLIPLDLHAECKNRKINLSTVMKNALEETLKNE
jgi:post-segregation antitoxin (ccd killing protein)